MIGIYRIITIVNLAYLQNSELPNLNICNVVVIGMGYVGLPLALEIAKNNYCLLTSKEIKREVIGFDINNSRIEELKKGIDLNNIFTKDVFDNLKNISFTNNKALIRNIDVYIVAVPTPINDKNEPDLTCLKLACQIVGDSLKGRSNERCNPVIIFESTVYPGVTEEICIPIIEEISCLKHNSEDFNNSFYCGYSPERINPGDKEHTINTIVKVTSGCNSIVSKWVNNFYGSFISAGTFEAASIMVAEAAKIIENTQRDINIALINEFAIIFKKLNLRTKDVLDAADTKWNFHKYMPGLVGGHCIGVDPYYLTFKSREIGYETKLISAGRKINDSMHLYLLDQIISHKKNRKYNFKKEEVLLLGLSYKSNCGDIRNSQLVNLAHNIKINNMEITIVDPKVNKENIFMNKGLTCFASIPKDKKYTIIIFALNHKEFEFLDNNELLKISYNNTLIFDLTNNLIGENVIYL